MHLTPEQIDRQPFRMRKRGYDIMQVRNFLREIADEMRARQRVRDELGTEDDPVAIATTQADEIIAAAEVRAEEIVAAAQVKVSGTDLDAAREEAEQLRDEARKEAAAIRTEAQDSAEQLSAEAEENARRRSDEVLRDTQTRLDGLLAQEREVHRRLRVTLDDLQGTIGDPAAEDSLDEVAAEAEPVVVAADGSLAEFMKAALRNEVAPD
jgi:DivIVA domain-containing protein